MEVATEARELVITRTLAAPRALVWKCLAEPARALQWWGPIEYPITQLSMGKEVGDPWRACLTGVENGEELWQSGVLKELDPPSRLAMTFAWEEEGQRGRETFVSFDLEEDGDLTRLTLRQTPFDTDANRDGHAYGWGSTFDRLEAYMTEMKESA